MEENEKLDELELKNEVQEDGVIDAPKTYSQEEVDEILKQKADEYEKSFDEKFNTRWGKEQRKNERNNKKERELINLLKNQTGTDDIEELLNLSYEQYGIDKPVAPENDEDLKILGKYDAQSILSLDLEDIEEEANRLAGIKRTAREEATFLELGKYLTETREKQKRKKEIEESGIDESILEDDDFKNFMGKFNQDTSLKEIVDFYNSTKQPKSKPFSAGSLKSKAEKEDSEFYTEEEFQALTVEDLKNPKIFEKARRTSLHLTK